MAPNTRLAAKAYATVSTETSIATVSPHALIQMLFEGALTQIDKAQQHAKARRRVEKAQALHRAIRIIEEGLNASLDMTQGTLAAHLRDVYAYSATCLLKAYSPQNEA
ncbi:MAG: flagellar protein FliS, partial [Betaproteobacteria bacterium]|nr:flagellar protein FliS [Betaproteobacteria bacterium]